MTPDEALDSLNHWIGVCRQSGQKGRAQKLESYAEVIKRQQAQIRQALDTKASTPEPIKAKRAPAPWRARAKELGIPLAVAGQGARKKEDVLRDIDAAENPKPVLEGADAPDV